MSPTLVTGGQHRSPALRLPFARVVAAVLVLVGCGDDPTGSSSPPRVAITPAEAPAFFMGDTLTVQATIRNSTRAEVVFSSSEPAVATIDFNSGLLRAIAPGKATITASAASDPRIFAELRIEVFSDLPASIALLALHDASDAEVDPGEVRGAVQIRLRVQRGNGRRLDVVLGDSVVCSADYPSPEGAPPPESEVVCALDSGAFDPATGAPHFANGERALSARLVASGERPLASLQPVMLRLANLPMIVTRTTATRQAIDGGGRTWLGGNVTIEAQPVLYDPGAAISRVSLRYRGPDGRDTLAIATESPFSALLLSRGALAGVTDSLFRIEIASERANGEAGPAGWTSPQRYDSAEPRPGTIAAAEWVGAQTRFADGYQGDGEWDGGVAGMTQRYFAADPALDSVAVVAQGVQVKVGSDLSQAGARAYRLAVQVCDALLNCAVRDGGLFGVDLTPPLVESVGIADRTANASTDLAIGVRDDLSGFPDRYLEATVSRLAAGAADADCGPVVEAVDLPGRTIGGACVADTLASPIPVPQSTPGYYRYSVVAFDRAGNRSATVSRVLLVDRDPPVLAPFSLPAALVAGEEAVIDASARDGVELAAFDFRLVYPEGTAGSIAIPFGPPVTAGTPFDAELTPEATVSGKIPFIRTLTYASDVAAPRRTVIVDSLQVVARDVAEQTAALARFIPRAAFANDTTTTDPFPRFGTAAATVDRTAVCTGGCGGGDPTSVKISVRVGGESGTGRPFARLHLYRRGPAGRMTHLGSLPGSEATITNSGTQSTFVYTFEHTPPPLLSGDFGIVAVGVSSRGNALVTAQSSPGAPVVTFYRR